MFRVWVLALALYQFGENTADPDLWAHTLFGEQNLLTGKIQKTEVYSWTARGLPFINHEVLAETIIGGSHLLGGGTGILLLKIIVGFLTFGIALGLGGVALAFVGVNSPDDRKKVEEVMRAHPRTWQAEWLRQRGLSDWADWWREVEGVLERRVSA